MKHSQEINTNEKYFFQLEPFVHINFNDETCFFYNTLNNESLSVNDSSIIEFLNELTKQENFRILEFNKLLSNKVFLNFTEIIISKQMGNVIVQNYTENKPIQIPPDIVIDKDINTYSIDEFDLIDDIKHYVHNVNIAINNDGFSKQKPLYLDSYKQFDSPSYDANKYKELPLDKIINFFETLDYLPQKIIISGGNIFSYNDFKQLINFFNKIETIIVYQIDINDFVVNKDKISFFNNDNSLFRVYISSIDAEISKLEEIKNIANISYHFIISCIDDYEIFNKVIEKLNIENYSFHPYYNEKNINFFMDNIAMNFDDIISQNENIKTIESKTKFNPKLFGNVYIDNLGHIRLHPTTSSIGEISNDLYLQIFKEFVHNKNNVWFLTRNYVKPCKECNFASLCPAISGYELYSEKYNFCNIK